ncbi:MAG: hypothetical protein U9Q15_02605 [Patescibacteria group bacterium]|nr:hypothetical protein [Patescibacteria group bacterium]
MFGPDSANTGFSGLNYVLDTTESTAHPELLGFWATFLESQGMSVIDMTAEEHDREAAYTQGITHFLGRVLDHFDIAPSSIATQGYKSLVELKENTCNDTKELFHDLQCLNRFTDPMRRELEKSFLEVDQEIKSGCVIGS